MKPNDIYYGKPEGLAKWSDYPIKIKLIREITAPYANKGQWEAVSFYVPKWSKGYVQELCQIWTVEQITATFTVSESGQNLV